MTKQPTFSDPRVEAAYQSGLVAIERIRRANKWDADGTLRVPFICYGCEKPKTNLCLTTGDGLPMCWTCFNQCAGILSDTGNANEILGI